MTGDKEALGLAAVTEIENYYNKTFLIQPLRCNAYIVALVDTLEKVLAQTEGEEAAGLARCLEKVLLAMQAEDFVAVRDYLWYELRPRLLDLGAK